jgi:hypothetical protein
LWKDEGLDQFLSAQPPKLFDARIEDSVAVRPGYFPALGTMTLPDGPGLANDLETNATAKAAALNIRISHSLTVQSCRRLVNVQCGTLVQAPRRSARVPVSPKGKA